MGKSEHRNESAPLRFLEMIGTDIACREINNCETNDGDFTNLYFEKT